MKLALEMEDFFCSVRLDSFWEEKKRNIRALQKARFMGQTFMG